MKFYIKTCKEIEKIERAKETTSAFISYMAHFCGKGPFEFIFTGDSTREWYIEKTEGYIWHKDWLSKFPLEKQYLLEFE